MSFNASDYDQEVYEDRAGIAARREREAEDERLYACHEPGCDAALDDTEKCEGCGGYFCDEDLYTGLCKACFEIELRAEAITPEEMNTLLEAA
jgi:hypothetical protein